MNLRVCSLNLFFWLQYIIVFQISKFWAGYIPMVVKLQLSWIHVGVYPNGQTSKNMLLNRCSQYKSILSNMEKSHTSSTAQGGGGSFKNRKPIGEIGCCQSRMAERIHWWTERWLELCFLDWLQWLQWSHGRSPHPQLLDVVCCSAAVVVV